MTFAKKTLTASLLAASALTGACDGFDSDATVAGPFDLRMFLVPSPGSTSTQALCESGTDASDRAQALVDELNAEVDADRALLAAISTAEGRGEGLITTYEASVDGRTMTVEVVADGAGNEAITGSIDGEQVLSGATSDDGAAGALTFGELSVAWQTEGDTLQAARSGAVDAAISLEDGLVRIVVGDVVAAWDDDDGVVIDGEDIQCFSGEELCGVDCAEIDTDGLAGDAADVGADI